MKIQPIGNIIQLDIEPVAINGLDTSSIDSAVEYAKVIGMPRGFTSEAYRDIGIGSFVFVKAWAIDIINHQGKKYYFVNLDTQGVLALVK